MKYYDKLIFELSQPGRCGFSLPENAWGTDTEALPATLRRDAEAELPEVRANSTWCATTPTCRI